MPPKHKSHARKPNITTPIPAEPEATPDDESIKLTCRNALNAFHSGNQRDALTMINEAYQKSALVQRTKANILFEAFFQLEDRSLQDFSLKSAVSAAQEAASWSPESIEFAQFYCFLLYVSLDDDQVYAKVAEECKYALSINDPIDPAEESVQEEAKTIKMVQDKLFWLIQQLVNVRSVKPSMETKITWIAGDIGIDHDQIAAAMLLRQQKSGPWVERFEKRSLMYLQCSVERIGQVWNRWNSFSDKTKEAFFHVKRSSLKSHFSWAKNKLLDNILSRAIEFFKTNHKMEVWVCWDCGREFYDHRPMVLHFTKDHLGPLPLNLLELLPQDVVHSEWVEMIMNGDQWKPGPEETNDEDWELRAKMLQRIHANFRLLLEYKCLAMSHVYKIIQYTASELQIGKDQTTLLSICSLMPSQLEDIDNLLLKLIGVCKLSLNSKNRDSSMDSQTVQDSSTDDSYSASLFLDDRLIGKVIFSRNKAGDDDLIYWLFNGSIAAYTDALESWEREKERERQQGMEVISSLRNKFVELKRGCDTKLKCIEWMDELEDVDRLCVEEAKGREQVLNHVPQSLESLLRQQLDALRLGEKDFSLLVKLLIKARGIQKEKSKGSEGGMSNDKHPSDECVLEAILAQKIEQDEEIAIIDAQIMMILAALREMELTLVTLSAVDYRPIVFPLMKIYIRKQLEIKVDEDEIARSWAVGLTE